ncbi:MAG: GTPase HflX [Coxiellaceae bacterium]|nr:GTPase HflX [Coxiellaceae bacterium]
MRTSKDSFIDRHRGGERALLMYVDCDNGDDYEEFLSLAFSSGVKVIDVMKVKRKRLEATYLIGTGKVDELVDRVHQNEIEVIITNRTLTPAQGRNLEKRCGCRVLDRTELILDIFASRARSYEGRLQVELAQLQHLSSRLVRGWTHLERQKGGIGLRGPGETQLETDRRLLAMRIKSLKKHLEKVVKQREQSRRGRKRAQVPTVSLVGYTNAGKSSLFNRLTDASVYAKDQLFATLDPTLRRVKLAPYGDVILADTVGFVRDLPHSVVAAFRATLEEVCQADLLLHVVDAFDDQRDDMMAAVNDVLKEIDANDIPQLQVYNKIDCRDGFEPRVDVDESGKPLRVWVSALTGDGFDLLQQAIIDRLAVEMIRTTITLAPEQARVRALLYQRGAILNEQVTELGHWQIEIEVEQELLDQLMHNTRANDD